MEFSQNSRSGSYLPTLDGWRAISILGVMLCHSFDRTQDGWAHLLSRHGAKGVDIFFAISGLLITTRLLESQAEAGTQTLAGFYIRRIFRIFPPYFFFLFALFIFNLFFDLPLSQKEAVSSVLFVRNYAAILPPYGWYTAHLWSIAVEEHFYLIFPLLLFAWAPSKRRSCIVLAMICLLIAIWRHYSFHHLSPEHWEFGLSFFTRSDVRLDSLLWGAIYALLLKQSSSKNALLVLVSGYRFWVFVGVWCSIVYFAVPGESFLIPLLSPLLLLGTLLHPSRRISRLFETRALLYIGRISYSLYLWNSLFMPAKEAPELKMGFSILQSFPLQWICTLTVATASYYWIEKPFIRMGYRLAPAPQKLRV
ncbi:MAG: acyltransferase [Bdellovibrionales bacterium]|nr:acyltransferase [Oligoflexia bacterium]